MNLLNDAEKIRKASLNSVRPGIIIAETIRNNDSLKKAKKICLIAIGKAATAMAEPIIKTFHEKIKSAVIITKYKHSYSFDSKGVQLEIIEASHPIPDDNSIYAAERVTNILKDTSREDTVVFLISGGGSALFTKPAESITLQDLQQITNALLRCGATIDELNTIRKHIDLVKGGNLLRHLKPGTQVLSFILSDVIGDDLSVIASGITVPDPSTFQDALNIIHKFNLENLIPKNVSDYILDGVKNKKPETLKKTDKIFKTVQNQIIGNNTIAAKAAAKEAEKLGYNTSILTTSMKGEAKSVGNLAASIANEITKDSYSIKKPACIIIGGETTVSLKGNGKGGRNQELALSAAFGIKDLKNVLIYSFGTDGTDGPTDAAGAYVSEGTINDALKHNLDAEDYLANNDSYTFFKQIKQLIITGPTGTNVNDLIFILIR